MNRLKAAAHLSPKGIRTYNSAQERNALYREEKKIIKDEFAAFGNNINWTDRAVKDKLHEFARQVIETVQTYMNQQDLVSTVLPAETVQPGDTFVRHELHGVNIYYGTYGASVRMSRPQFTKYTASPNPKEAGLDLDLAQIRTGKYSPSELADYTTGLITAWRNHLLFTTTLAGMSVYQSGGAQYQAGTSVAFGTMDTVIAKLTDAEDVGWMVGRRAAIHKLSNMSGWSDNAKDEFKSIGNVGSYAGIPIMKVNSFTDPDYGTVYPMPSNEIWLFSTLPAGVVVYADRLRTAEETTLKNETLQLYFRWDDGIGIWYTNRIARLAAIT